ncbi:MAG: amidohydrolase family protein [Bacteroidales bacterium]|nr:amidohydrolase family protein [Bacteroidales bacterium]
MRRFSAQYIITATGSILKRGIITTDDHDCIREVIDTGGNPPELSKTEFYNGIITPGFVNCHCHLELSGSQRPVGQHTGLGEFIRGVRESRKTVSPGAEKHMAEADKMMYNSGVSACGDVCNDSISFAVKEDSPIKYINFLEVFGIDPAKADKRISEVMKLKEEAGRYTAASFVVPHSFYSMSASLLKKIKILAKDNELSTIHFMESGQEAELMKNAGGALMDSYRAMGISPEMLHDRVPDHISGLREYITTEGRLILVHNTYAGNEEIQAAMERANCYFCLCPGSNLYIENTLPPVDRLREMKPSIVLGTDSLASNKSLDILEEMKIIGKHFPGAGLPELVQWATINGARALKIDNEYGSIETGKKPGLVLIKNADLSNMSLTAESKSIRLL